MSFKSQLEIKLITICQNLINFLLKSKFSVFLFVLISLYLGAGCTIPPLSSAPPPVPENSQCTDRFPRFESTRAPIRNFGREGNTLYALYRVTMPFGTFASFDYSNLILEDGSEVEIRDLYRLYDLSDENIEIMNGYFDNQFAAANPKVIDNIFRVMPESTALFERMCELDFRFHFWREAQLTDAENVAVILEAFNLGNINILTEMLSGQHATTGEDLTIDTVDESGEITIKFWFAPQANTNPLKMGLLSGSQIWAALIQKIDLWLEAGEIEGVFSNLESIRSDLEIVMENEHESLALDIAEYRDSGYFDTSIFARDSALKTYIWQPRALPFIALSEVWQAVGFTYWASQHPLQLTNIERLSNLDSHLFYQLIERANEDLGSPFQTKTVVVSDAGFEPIDATPTAPTSLLFADPISIKKVFSHDENQFAIAHFRKSPSLFKGPLLYFDEETSSWRRHPVLINDIFEITEATDCHQGENTFYCLVFDPDENPDYYQVYRFNLDQLTDPMATRSTILERQPLNEIINIVDSTIESFENIKIYRLIKSPREGSEFALLMFDGDEIFYWDPLLESSAPKPLVDLELNSDERLVSMNLHQKTDEDQATVTLVIQSNVTDPSLARTDEGISVPLDSQRLTIKQAFFNAERISDESITESTLWQELDEINNHASLIYNHPLNQTEIHYFERGEILIHIAGSSSLSLYSSGQLQKLKVRDGKNYTYYHLYDVSNPDHWTYQHYYGRDVFWPLWGDIEDSPLPYAYDNQIIAHTLHVGDWLQHEDKAFLKSAINITDVAYSEDETGSITIDFILNWQSQVGSTGITNYSFDRKQLLIE